MKKLIISVSILILSGCTSKMDGYMLTVCANSQSTCSMDGNSRRSIGFSTNEPDCMGRRDYIKKLGIQNAECIRCKGFHKDTSYYQSGTDRCDEMWW